MDNFKNAEDEFPPSRISKFQGDGLAGRETFKIQSRSSEGRNEGDYSLIFL